MVAREPERDAGALAADGTSRVRGIELINRGYEDFLDKLDGLGARVSAG